MQILSDKAYRKTKLDKFEAVGNVIITHTNKALYGEKATFSMQTGDIDVIGNVRYIGPEMTLYGSSLHYNFKSRFLEIQNARLFSDNYVVIGKKMIKHSDGIITGQDAEYTTCKDCPESWSIYGKDVHITRGEYIRIKHAFLKIKGVVVMYFPYIILPIKKNRETGLLFPKFGVSKEGPRFQQPWFWAIDSSSDLTLIPSIYGSRGIGNELQFRKVLGDRKWFEINSLQVNDRIFSPGKTTDEVSGQHVPRHFSDYEHHFSVGHSFNHHFYFNDANDLDMIRDFTLFTDERVKEGHLGGGGFFEFRHFSFDVYLEGHFYKNFFVDNSRKFDHQYVQRLPKLSFSLPPITFMNTEYFFLKKISFGLDSDFTVFKQNHVSENNFIRNAHRINGVPYLDWRLGEIGPFSLKTQARLEQQYYYFPYEKTHRKFSKRALIYESEISVEIDKIFGLAYESDIPLDQMTLALKKEYLLINEKKERIENEKKSVEKRRAEDNLIGKLPSFDHRYVDDTIKVIKNSYRHSQTIKLKHYYLTDEKITGSTRFKGQIDNDLNGENGHFDYRDTLKSQEHKLVDLTTATSIPINNTFEIQWNHSIVRKRPNDYNAFVDGKYLREQFKYEKIAYLNISQGYDVNAQGVARRKKRLKDSLTRLYVQAGLTQGSFSLSASEYFFYLTDKHVFSLDLSKTFFERLKLTTSFNYKSVTIPVDKTIGLTGSFKINDLFHVSGLYNYDMEEQQGTRTEYAILYTPPNNCWKFGLNYLRSLIEKDDKRISFNLLINFNDNSFTSLAGQ